jgi:hypothetical protein
MSDTATLARPRRALSKALCTRHASINLHKPTGMHKEVWQSFSLDNLEDFTRMAKNHLRDASNLKTSTIDNADYAELLDWFREMADWKPKKTRKVKKTTLDINTDKANEILADLDFSEESVLARNTDGLSLAVEPVTLVAVNAGDGTVRIHAHGCADIKKDRQVSETSWTIIASTRAEVDQDVWGDVAADRFTEGTEEWKQACTEDASIASVYLPCVTLPSEQPVMVKRGRRAKVVAAAAPTVTVSIPVRRKVPQNWLDMRREADTLSARKYWIEYCEKYARGEV